MVAEPSTEFSVPLDAWHLILLQAQSPKTIANECNLRKFEFNLAAGRQFRWSNFVAYNASGGINLVRPPQPVFVWIIRFHKLFIASEVLMSFDSVAFRGNCR